MSQSLRQNNLFLGEDWTVIYQAMKSLNFNSYDYDTIRQALVDYIRVNYPEDFNDWIESSEFVAIIEMLSYLASSLAFRIDLNVRENFLDTATRRESIFRLARFLSYNPRRCVAAQGLIKINSVRTDQAIYDSNGVNLQNLVINWNDANNPDWFEQFILVLNASLQPSNPFGQPVKSGTVGSSQAERYDFNNVVTNDLVYTFSSPVNGQSMNFEMCNVDFLVADSGSINVSSSGYFFEKAPNVFNPWSMVYRNDGNGNGSAQTGFFMLFKQGSLGYVDYLLESAVPNRVIDLSAININQSDVWAVTIDDAGIPLTTWTKVPALLDSNLVYNDVNRLTRDIFQVITRDQNGDDSVSLRFGDGSFGNIPTGRLRVYYRTSNNLTYTVLPQDMSNINLSLRYNSINLNTNTLTLGLGLTYPVANSISRESNNTIRERASAVYYTQNRMVNGEDYNLFPLQNTQALKIRSVNRTYSGQSRFIDINDPTGAYQNTKVFSDDGILYREITNSYLTILNSRNLNTQQIVQSELQPLLNGTSDTENVNIQLRDFYLSTFDTDTTYKGAGLRWYQTGISAPTASVGVFGRPNLSVTNSAAYTVASLPQSSAGLWSGSWVKFDTGTWVRVVSSGTSQTGSYGVLISGQVPNNTGVSRVIPPLRVTFTAAEEAAIVAAINLKQNFGLRYDLNTITWKVIPNTQLAVDADYNTVSGSDWLVQFVYQSASGWQVTVRGMRYVFESVADTTFYLANTTPVIDNQTLVSARDNIRVLRYNLNGQGQPLPQDLRFGIISQQVYPDGYVDPRQVRVSFWDNNNDNLVDDPESFSQLVSSDGLVFWTRIEQQGNVTWEPINSALVMVEDTLNLVPDVNSTIWTPGKLVYVRNPGIFLQYIATPYPALRDVSSNYRARTGRRDISYCWQHYASSDSRIDPAVMNIIDAYVLTTNYDTSIRNWISRGRPTDPQPQPPTPEDLRNTFGELDNYKMMTDQIVWHPISYKLLFGSQAAEPYQAVFKVVKLTNSGATDTEIKSRVIQAIDNYFSVVNWDFGQSFYFTELAAYIHQQMPTLLSSVVIMPVNSDSQFGDLFEIRANPDEMFLSAARVTDVQIVPNLNPAELRLQ